MRQRLVLMGAALAASVVIAGCGPSAPRTAEVIPSVVSADARKAAVLLPIAEPPPGAVVAESNLYDELVPSELSFQYPDVTITACAASGDEAIDRCSGGAGMTAMRHVRQAGTSTTFRFVVTGKSESGAARRALAAFRTGDVAPNPPWLAEYVSPDSLGISGYSGADRKHVEGMLARHVGIPIALPRVLPEGYSLQSSYASDEDAEGNAVRANLRLIPDDQADAPVVGLCVERLQDRGCADPVVGWSTRLGEIRVTTSLSGAHVDDALIGWQLAPFTTEIAGFR